MFVVTSRRSQALIGTLSRNEHYNKGIALYDDGQYVDAIAEFQRVLESALATDAPEKKLASFYMCEAYATLGLAHLNMVAYRRAEEELKAALAIHPDYADLNFHLALVYYRQRRYAKAEKQLKKAIAINPKYARGLMYLGLSRLHRKDSAGIEDIEWAVAIEPAYQNEEYRQALFLYRQGDTTRAIRYLEEVAETDVDHISGLVNKGLQLMRDREYGEATNAFLEAISLCPDYADLRHYLGLCYMRQGMMELAAGQFSKALELNPNFITAAVNLAIAYEKDGKHELAIQTLQQVCTAEPNNLIASKLLSRLSNK